MIFVRILSLTQKITKLSIAFICNFSEIFNSKIFYRIIQSGTILPVYELQKSCHFLKKTKALKLHLQLKDIIWCRLKILKCLLLVDESLSACSSQLLEKFW